MISISSDTETVTINESIPDSDYGEILPRVSRTATLDGGAMIATSGCSHSDRTIVISALKVSVAQEAVLRRMTMQTLLVQLSNSEGVFTGVLSRFSCKAGKLEFTFLVKEKLTSD
jgi:hypothetical protein